MTRAAQYLLECGKTQADIARLMRTTPQSVHQWLKEGVLPNSETIKKMRDRLGVHPGWWFEAAKKAG